jgi:lysophospholipid hydrolase
VLGGGGARGLAHLGVIRALEEANIPIDAVAGTSQGAFMSGLYARHLSSEGIIEPTKQFCGIFSLFNIIKALTLPMLSYFEGRGFSEAIYKAFGNMQIEDLWIPYFCTTTNMSKSQLITHSSGDLWRACRASMSVLGFLPPVIDHSGDVLIDGGYVNNLPVDVMKAWANPSTIIAVDVEDKTKTWMFTDVYNYGTHVSGWKLLYYRLFSSRNLVKFSELLLWLTCINHDRTFRANKDKLIDMYIRPDTTQFGLMDYNKVDELVQIGYEAAKKAIKEYDRKQQAAQTQMLLMQPRTGSGVMRRNASMAVVRHASDSNLHRNTAPLLSSSVGAGMRHVGSM